jgi:hypothetical protein
VGSQLSAQNLTPELKLEVRLKLKVLGLLPLPPAMRGKGLGVIITMKSEAQA